MYRFRRLVVGLSDTDADAGLLRYAAMVARLGTAAEVRFVHVLRTQVKGAADADRVRAELDAAVTREFADVPEARRPIDVVSGPLLDRLLEYVGANTVDLMFLGHRRDHPGRWALARRLAKKAGCSVWMVPDGARPTLDRVLAPIDFSEHSADTLRVAAAMTRLAGGTECLALHVYFNDAAATYEGYDQVLRGQEAEAFRAFIAPIDTQGVTVTPLFEEGANVAHVINRVAEAQGCDLVVMATRGRSRSAAVLLGSVTEETIVETRVPLLVVKHYGAQLGLIRALFDKVSHPSGTKFD
jgi:nucleotide-binding universal stress UspA family protein